MNNKIIYEDAYVLVYKKPAGLATQTAKVGQADVVSDLKNYLKNPYIGVVHRLDQPVEGLLVFGKTKSATANLTKQLSGHTFDKHYYAIVCGQQLPHKGELVDYLTKDSVTKKAVVVALDQTGKQEGKKAILQYKLIETITTPKPLGLMDIHIETGRFHQIRAQMANAAMPLLGDNKYGDAASLAISSEVGVRNVALCAYKIGFNHPSTGVYLEYTIMPEGKAFTLFANESYY